MAYDVALAARVRAMLADNPTVREQTMFGGLAFLLAGRMAVAASGQGGLLVRVGAEHAERLLATTAAQPMEMKGRTMRGWLHIDGEHLQSKRQLAEWIAIGTAASLAASTG
ncbi:TfoX/Sxy family protein [Mycolicibacterium pulveris]|uniref:TfoX/Sxy family protein n=1 Tax=Mycolicibacterium pulveris TaxID=36813 RepID=UPI003CE9606A